MPREGLRPIIEAIAELELAAYGGGVEVLLDRPDLHQPPEDAQLLILSIGPLVARLTRVEHPPLDPLVHLEAGSLCGEHLEHRAETRALR